MSSHFDIKSVRDDCETYLRHKLLRTEQEMTRNDGEFVEENNKGISLLLPSFSNLLLCDEQLGLVRLSERISSFLRRSRRFWLSLEQTQFELV